MFNIDPREEVDTVELLKTKVINNGAHVLYESEGKAIYFDDSSGWDIYELDIDGFYFEGSEPFSYSKSCEGVKFKIKGKEYVSDEFSCTYDLYCLLLDETENDEKYVLSFLTDLFKMGKEWVKNLIEKSKAFRDDLHAKSIEGLA